MMLSPMVYVEERNGVLSRGSLGLLEKARELDAEPVALLCGPRSSELAADLGQYGACRVIVADDPVLAGPLAHPRVDVVMRLVERDGFDTLLFENSSLTADVAAALAVRLDAGVNWDLSNLRILDGKLIGERLALNDTALVEVGWTTMPQIAVMRGGVLEPSDSEGNHAQVEAVDVTFDRLSQRVHIVERTAQEASQATIETADVIVAGGRGLSGKESLKLLEDLADALGGAVAVTMPLVDRGWYPHANQIGQTGRTVRPRLYIGCGISGAVQHRVGMNKSGTIVAINTDRSAPIFAYSDIGVVGNAERIVPRVTELVRAARQRRTSE
jgi:electron transfer flavoprotein alpha subunit